MKKIFLFFSLIAFTTVFVFAQSVTTKVFTIFTSGGCGCTGSGGAPKTFTTHEQVVSALQKSCSGVDFIVWNGSRPAAYDEIQKNKANYDGVLIIGSLQTDFRLAFTGLPTILVYNLWEWHSNIPYNLLATGKVPEGRILEGGTDYKDVKILTAQLDRRNVCAPPVRESMFNDLVYKIKLIKVISELKETRILMLSNKDEVIAQVNYRGDINESFPEYHNLRYIQNFKELFGVDIVRADVSEFYEMYGKINTGKAEEIAEQWIRGARKVIASRSEIIKSARGYLAIDALREKYKCNAVSAPIRSITGSGELKDRFNPGMGLELGFKTRGIQAVCQNYPDILLSQVLAYKLTGRPSMLADVIYDVDNSVEMLLHCGIPINVYGDERRIPYTIRTHAESPVRDRPEEPGSSTGLTAEWPVGEPVTIWEIHSLIRKLRLHTGEVVDGHAIYTGGEDLDDIMCTAKVIARVDAKKLRDQYMPSFYGIHTTATLGDLRQQLKDIAVLMGFGIDESDKK